MPQQPPPPSTSCFTLDRTWDRDVATYGFLKRLSVPNYHRPRWGPAAEEAFIGIKERIGPQGMNAVRQALYG